MHHRERRGLPDWAYFTGQMLAWAVAVGIVLFFVTACKQEQPPPGEPGPGPTFVRERASAPSCGRCFDRPGLGHAS